MNSNEIKERVQELASAVGMVELTERQFVFNQLFMSYIRMNDIKTQGETYEEIYSNIVNHYDKFKHHSIYDLCQPNYVDAVNDYLMYHVRAEELTQTEKHEQTRQDAYDLLEGCLGAEIIGYEDITKYNQPTDQPPFKQKMQTAKLSMLQNLNNSSLDSLNKMHDLLTDINSKA